MVRLFIFIAYFSLTTSLWAVATTTQLTYGEAGFPSTLDPITTNDMLAVRLGDMLFNGLISFDDRSEPQADLAESWEVAKDNSSITFKLRKNVFWHATDEKTEPHMFSANDVNFTVQLMQDPKTQTPQRIRFEFIDSVEEIDPLTVKISFKRPMTNVLGKLAFKIIPKFAFGDKTNLQRNDNFAIRPIGTGEYQLEKVTSEGEVFLKRNEKFYGKKPQLEQVIMKPFADRTIMSQALLFKAIDLITVLNPSDVPQIEADKRFRLIPYNALSYSFFAFNFRNPILKQKAIRQAISLAINRQEMLNSFFNGGGKIVTGPYAPGSWAYNLDVAIPKFDPEAAKKILQQAGYTRKGSDGVFEKNGQPLNFNLRVPIASENESVKRVILAFQSYLGQVGIQIKVDFLEWHVWKKEVFETNNFDIVYASWSFDDSNDISSLFHSGEIGSWKNNIGGYRNTEVDALIMEAKTTVDFEKKRTINRKLHELLADDLPYTFLWTLTHYAAISNNIRNVDIHPYRFFTFIDRWYREQQ